MYRSVWSIVSPLARLLVVAGLGWIVLSALPASSNAQEDEKPKNLKVLDPKISHDDLMKVMGKFTSALGVGCDHCHFRGANEREPNFASDSNKVKLTARAMLQMVNQINGNYIGHLTTVDTPSVTVECVTCHRGQVKPILIQDLLKRERKQHGMAAVDSVYRALRKNYYGSATYDFSDLALAQLAFEVAQESNPDALTLLKLNKEFNPNSAMNEWAMGRVYVGIGDTTSAIASYKHALELNPNYRRAQHELDMLQGHKSR